MRLGREDGVKRQRRCDELATQLPLSSVGRSNMSPRLVTDRPRAQRSALMVIPTVSKLLSKFTRMIMILCLGITSFRLDKSGC